MKYRTLQFERLISRLFIETTSPSRVNQSRCVPISVFDITKDLSRQNACTNSDESRACGNFHGVRVKHTTDIIVMAHDVSVVKSNALFS